MGRDETVVKTTMDDIADNKGAESCGLAPFKNTKIVPTSIRKSMVQKIEFDNFLSGRPADHGPVISKFSQM